MKQALLLCIFFLIVVGLQAQVTVIESPKKIATPVKMQTIPTGPQPQLTQGKDIGVRIDRVEDNSTFDENKFTVYYSLINSGTENINIGMQNFKIEGVFYKLDDAYVGAGGSVYTNSLGKTILNSGETLQSTLNLREPRLVRNATYKLKLVTNPNNRFFDDLNKLNDVATTTVTARAIKNSEYFMTYARLTIQTGNDNKELNNSMVYFYVGPANYNDPISFFKGDFANGNGYANEMKTNSTTEMTLDPYGDLYSPYKSLCFYKQRGLALTIIYDNKAWATDAWEIKNIALTIEFKDKNGNPYPNPAYASKTINFPNSAGLLGFRLGDDIANNKNQIRVVTLGTDQDLNPLPPEFKKYQGAPFLRFASSPLLNAPIIYCN